MFSRCPKFKKDSYQFLTLREIEYMEYIKKKDSVLYGDILTKLNDKSTCWNTVPQSEPQHEKEPSNEDAESDEGEKVVNPWYQKLYRESIKMLIL